MHEEIQELIECKTTGYPVGVGLRKIEVHRDPRGTLAEVLRIDWPDVCGSDVPFAQAYVSMTPPGIARDEDRWHLHQFQTDRFVCLVGRLVFALADARPGGASPKTIALVELASDRDAPAPVLLTVPPGILHGFVATGATPAVLLSMPSRLHDGTDETRVPFSEAQVRMPSGLLFSYDMVRSFHRHRDGEQESRVPWKAE